MCTVLVVWLLHLSFTPFRKRSSLKSWPKKFRVEPCSQAVDQGWLLGLSSMDKTALWKSFYVELSNFVVERKLGRATAQKGNICHPIFHVRTEEVAWSYKDSKEIISQLSHKSRREERDSLKKRETWSSAEGHFICKYLFWLESWAVVWPISVCILCIFNLFVSFSSSILILKPV